MNLSILSYVLCDIHCLDLHQNMNSSRLLYLPHHQIDSIYFTKINSSQNNTYLEDNIDVHLCLLHITFIFYSF